MTPDDVEFMQAALEEAVKSKDEDQRDHPRVGAVLVRDGRIVDRAHRGELGPGDHAEYTLLHKKLRESIEVANATLYVTLEPCTDRSPEKTPCVERIIERKIARVVIGMLDPNKKIRGLGEQKLREANVQVGRFDPSLTALVEDLNREFFRSHTQSKSLVTRNEETVQLPPDATVAQIVQSSIQMRDNERKQITQAFDAGHYEMMGSFVWLKTIALLKEQLVSLGMEFIGEMLGQSDFGPDASIDRVSEAELILLAEDLGIIRQTVAIRLRHTRQLVNHFTSTRKDGDEETMAREEAVGCLRACAQGILARENINLLDGFIEFRAKLESQNLHREAPELGHLLASPYFFRRTILRALLSMLKSRTGAQLENAAANINLILPELWPSLGRPDRWHCGEVYAELHASNAGIPVAALKKALTSVNGFDYVPEGIRSAAFMTAAGEVLAAHDGHNNYYTERPALEKLIALGSTIPPPAIFRCLTAILSVELGHHCGHSWEAARRSREFLGGLPLHRWEYYLSDCLPADRIILGKLQSDVPKSRWIALVKALDLSAISVKNPSVTMLLAASRDSNDRLVGSIAVRMNSQLGMGS